MLEAGNVTWTFANGYQARHNAWCVCGRIQYVIPQQGLEPHRPFPIRDLPDSVAQSGLWSMSPSLLRKLVCEARRNGLLLASRPLRHRCANCSPLPRPRLFVRCVHAFECHYTFVCCASCVAPARLRAWCTQTPGKNHELEVSISRQGR